MSARRVVVRGQDDVIRLEAVMLYLESGQCPGGGEVDEEDPETRASKDRRSASVAFKEDIDLALLCLGKHKLLGKSIRMCPWTQDWENNDGNTMEPHPPKSTPNFSKKESAGISHIQPTSKQPRGFRSISSLSLEDQSKEIASLKITPTCTESQGPTSLTASSDSHGRPVRNELPAYASKDRPKPAPKAPSREPRKFTAAVRSTNTTTSGHTCTPSANLDMLSSDKVAESTLMVEKTSEQINFKDTVKLPSEILGFVYHLIDKDPTIKVNVRKVAAGLELCGPHTDVTASKLKIYELAARIEKEAVNDISGKLVKLVSEPPCFDDIINAFANRHLEATLSARGDHLYIISMDTNTSSDTLHLFQKLVISKSLLIKKEKAGFMEEKNWRDAVRSLTMPPRIVIYTDRTNLGADTKVLVEGMSDQVETAVATLNELILEMDRVAVVTATIDLSSAVWKLFKERVKLDELLQFDSYMHRPILRYKEDNGKYQLHISGPNEEVNSSRDEIKGKILPKIKKDTINVQKPGLTLERIQDTQYTRQLQTIEIIRKCTIEVTAYESRIDTVEPSKEREMEEEEMEASEDFSDIFYSESTDEWFRQTQASLETTTENPVHVVQGDLSLHQSDVLVCTVVYNTKELVKSGVVGKAFALAGGPETEEGYSVLCKGREGALPLGDVYVCDKVGRLNCKSIIYVPLRQWKNKGRSKLMAVVQKIIRKCLAVVGQRGHRSLAFPTIGCGKLGFPPDLVATCFSKCVQEDDSMGNIEVTIVAYEQKLATEFKDILQDASTPKPIHLPKPVIPRVSISAKSEKTHHIDISSSMGVSFQITAMDMSTFAGARDDIISMTGELLHEEHVNNTGLKQLSDIEKTALYALGSCAVEINLDESQGSVVVAGEKVAVQKVMKELGQLLIQVEQRLRDPNEIRRRDGLNAYLEALGEGEPMIPTHWTLAKSKSNSRIRDALGLEQKFSNVDSALAKSLEQLVMKTWDTARVGHGADASSLSHSSIKIKKILLNESPYLYQCYSTKVKEACSLVGKGWKKITPITSLDGESEVQTAIQAGADVQRLRLDSVNEYFLFHGTNSTASTGIAKQGLDFRLSNKGLFGRGVYFAESSTKADQYSDRGNRHDGSHFMYICRVLMTNPYLCKGARDFRRPPCAHVGCNDDKCTTHTLHDSVMGVAKDGGIRLLFREFVIFDYSCCYPEFLVEYERV